jgi:hypothetical protein
MENPEVQKQVREATKENLGVEFALQSDKVKEDMKHNNLEKWGYEYTLQVPEIREKGKLTSIEHWGTDHWTKSEEGRKRLRDIGLENSYENKKKFKPNFKKNSWGIQPDAVTVATPFRLRVIFKTSSINLLPHPFFSYSGLIQKQGIK